MDDVKDTDWTVVYHDDKDITIQQVIDGDITPNQEKMLRIENNNE